MRVRRERAGVRGRKRVRVRVSICFERVVHERYCIFVCKIVHLCVCGTETKTERKTENTEETQTKRLTSGVTLIGIQFFDDFSGFSVVDESGLVRGHGNHAVSVRRETDACDEASVLLHACVRVRGCLCACVAA